MVLRSNKDFSLLLKLRLIYHLIKQGGRQEKFFTDHALMNVLKIRCRSLPIKANIIYNGFIRSQGRLK
jgi:hypothetical protein